MNLKHHFALLLGFGMLLSACKKSNNAGPAAPTVKPKYLTRMITIEIHPHIDNFTTTTDYTYDAQKRLSTIKSGDRLYNYAYDGNNQLYSIEAVNQGARTYYEEFSYEGGKVKSAVLTTYQNNAVFNQVKWDYVYNAKGQVTETHHEVYYELYEYDSNNNISKISYHGSTDYATLFAYDNKKSRFTNSPLKSVIGIDPAGDRCSPNNGVKISYTGLADDNVPYPTSYVYDSDGYPIAGLSGTADNGSKFTLIYSTLE